mmetsp:Transcript_7284/g.15243  ORF Transcript_7284/g.15243 Transcript_7284/m.15243 type:complete len:383 (+) Transcript_7284:76-1224(+)
MYAASPFAACIWLASIAYIEAFTPLPHFECTLVNTDDGWRPSRVPCNNVQQKATAKTTTSLSATRKKKLSMAEKRKRRGRKLPPRKVERPAVLDRTPRVDSWAKTRTTDESVAAMKEQEDAAAAAAAAADNEIQARAAALVESQRKSVDTLTLIRERVEALPYAEMAEALRTEGYYVRDNFLDKEELIGEMEQEALTMMVGDTLERDLSNLESGEFTTAIQGGEDQYADLPRTVEYIVSLTRHMPPMIDEQKALDGCLLDAAASTGTLRVFDRKARESSLALLSEAPPAREFGLANEDNSSDLKKVTVLYFISPVGWDGKCGGGVAFEADGSVIAPARDRLLVFLSDSTLYRMEPFSGREGVDNCSYIVNHLLRKSTDENQA